ncbi:O-antigen ligase family protein [Sphingomonas sp. Leaf343]|uniref:O-antigen ligase family protein n=1 Tax=Sphingomonas sp. Leaf343 TaxID=1736345 RepID=UPI000A4BA628|nr:O-antigen ligase family protein [Sphingomonas sp. Leaf343]
MSSLARRVPLDRLSDLVATIRRRWAGDGDRPAPAIGRYVHASWFRRHRILCFVALTLFSILYGFSFAILGRYLLVQLTAPLLVLGCIVLWVLPDAGAAPVRALGASLMAFMFALLCWPDYIAFAVPGLPWVTATRLFGVPMVLIMLYCMATSSAFRDRIWDIINVAPEIWKLFVAFNVLAALSIALSDNIPASINKFVIAQVSWTTVFFAACYIFTEPGRIKRMAAYLWGITIYCCLIGLYEIRYEKLPWAGRIPSFLKIEDEQVLRVLAGLSRAASGVYRVQSKFGISLSLGEFFGLALPFILHLIVNTKTMWVRLLGVVTLAMVFVVTLRTDSRLAFIGFIVALLLYALYWSFTYWRTNRQSIFAAALMLAYPAGLVAFITLAFAWRRLERLILGGGAQQASTDSRKDQYAMGWRILKHNPIGHGIGEAATTLGYRVQDGTLTIDTYYLAVALEYGVLGFVIYYAMFLFGIARAASLGMKTKDPEIVFIVPTCIALVNFFISKSVFSQQENHPLAFLLLGIVVALSWRQRIMLQEVGAVPPPRATVVGATYRAMPRIV